MNREEVKKALIAGAVFTDSIGTKYCMDKGMLLNLDANRHCLGYDINEAIKYVIDHARYNNFDWSRKIIKEFEVDLKELIEDK